MESKSLREADQFLDEFWEPLRYRHMALSLEEARNLGYDVDSMTPSIGFAEGPPNPDDFMVLMELKPMTAPEVDRVARAIEERVQREGQTDAMTRIQAALLEDRDMLGRFRELPGGSKPYMSPEQIKDEASEMRWVLPGEPTTSELSHLAGPTVTRRDPRTGKTKEVGGYSGLKTQHEQELSGREKVLSTLGLPGKLKPEAPIAGGRPQLYTELGGARSTPDKVLPRLTRDEEKALRNAIRNPDDDIAVRTLRDFAAHAGVSEGLDRVAAAEAVNKLRSRFGEALPRMAASGAGVTAYAGDVLKKAVLRADPVFRFLAPLSEEVAEGGAPTRWAGELAPEWKRALGWMRTVPARARDTKPTPQAIASLNPMGVGVTPVAAGAGAEVGSREIESPGPETVQDMGADDIANMYLLLQVLAAQKEGRRKKTLDTSERIARIRRGEAP
jgi:hypothetical protein